MVYRSWTSILVRSVARPHAQPYVSLRRPCLPCASPESSLSEQEARLKKIRDSFAEHYGQRPQHYGRSPGRVNLIGEHIDYEGYGVLPMAIGLDTVVAIRVNTSRDAITLRNTDDVKFPELSYSTDPDQKLDTSNHTWGSYVIAAYKGVFDHLRARGYKEPKVCGLDILVDGRVPTGSGLSSSAAIVCASSLAIMAALKIGPIKKGEVAEFTAKAEQYVGVISGGMDQAISIMGKKDEAALIEFNPVRATPVSIPDGTAFVVAHSLKVSNKAETSVGHYNLRVVECTIASAMLAKKLGATKEQILREYKTLKAVEGLIEAYYLEHRDAAPKDDSNWCVVAVDEYLKEGDYTTKEIESEEGLGFKVAELFAEDDEASKLVLDSFDTFKLHARATHVYTEKQRVYDFAQVCADTRYSYNRTAEILGRLMDSSHESCDKNYDCSCPELNALVKFFKETHRAYGARMTGAGWGGCVVALVEKMAASLVVSNAKYAYYDKLEQVKALEDDREAYHKLLDEAVFVSVPSQGGCLLRPFEEED